MNANELTKDNDRDAEIAAREAEVRGQTSNGSCNCGGDCPCEIRETHDGLVERWACAHT